MLNILSLFDWMSCGQIALNRLWISNYRYFASEIDKYTIQVTQKNFPNTFHIGNIQKCSYWFDNVFSKNRKKYLFWEPREGLEDTMWRIDNFDLIIWWSPCQGFSFAGNQLNFDDPRSSLFFEYVRIIKEVKPKYFLLENVQMKKEYQDVISEHLFGIQPIEINSSLVSAQKRRRLYWVGELCSDGTYRQVKIKQPEDRWILLKDILEKNVDEKYYKNNIVKINNQLIIHEATNLWYIEVKPWECFDYTHPNSTTRRGRSMIEKSNCMTAGNFDFMYYYDDKIRKLTPIECERLQTVPDNYTESVSDSQRYKMLGNGWTVDVIVHILSHFNLEKWTV